jgi:hypothetical protein
MSRPEKLLLYDVLQEKKRREREKGAVYKPNSGQLPVHVSQKTTRLVTSGNGAGKTAMGCNEALWWCQGYNPITKLFTKVPARVIVVLDHPDKVADQWLPELQKWANIKDEDLHKRGKPYVSKIARPNNSEILFMFHEQSPLQFESIETDYIIFDEPPPRHVWIALRRGARKKGRVPRFLIVATLTTGAWLRKEILDPCAEGNLPDTECFRFSTRCNEQNLAEGYIDSYSSILSEREKLIRIEGQPYDLEGLALAHLFDRSVHVIPPFPWRKEDPTVVVIDPHPSKPHHAILLGCDKEGFLYYLKEFKEKSIARVFGKHLKEFYRGYRVVDIVCDCLGNAEYTGGEGFKSFIQILREPDVDVQVRATTYDDKQDDDFIDRIKSAIGIPEEPNNFGQCIPKFRIFDGNPGIVSNIENVQWLKYRGYDDEFRPKLDITDKDFLSCLKYGLATNLTPLKGKAKIYRRTGGAETYGITPKDSVPGGWRQDFRRIKSRFQRQRDQAKKDKESFEDF